ncbi:unnamed protein product [Moneuplotes crassus]|uniref:LITAF domain-containing protein n=1 Tax=Euplotes crassus TaxID=5936 RepID=A0AAD2D3T1_EUPCR|nr:unnamed protein product [Moneuplotes crassus]
MNSSKDDSKPLLTRTPPVPTLVPKIPPNRPLKHLSPPHQQLISKPFPTPTQPASAPPHTSSLINCNTQDLEDDPFCVPLASKQLFKGRKTSICCRCTECHKIANTRVVRDTRRMQWYCSMVICGSGLWCFSWIPFCISEMKKDDHYCDQCGKILSEGDE